MLAVAAIDPGLDGAIAILGDDGSLECFNMPTFALEKSTGKGKSRRVDCSALVRRLRHKMRIRHIFVEAVHSMPNKEGHQAAFGFGRAFGIVEGVIAALEIPVTFITPQTWKRFYKLSSDKELSRLRATEIIPAGAAQWEMVRGVVNREQAGGRAEAALLAVYGIRVCLKEPA